MCNTVHILLIISFVTNLIAVLLATIYFFNGDYPTLTLVLFPFNCFFVILFGYLLLLSSGGAE